MNARRALPAIALAVLFLAGCPKGSYHTLVSIEHDYATTVKGLQNTTANEFAAGTIDAATNQTIEALVVKLGQGGQAVNTLLQQNASKQAVAAQIANISSALQGTIANGLSGIKDPTKKQEFTVLLQTVSDVVANFQTELGGAK